MVFTPSASTAEGQALSSGAQVLGKKSDVQPVTGVNRLSIAAT
jgi:hypothetical protein